MSLRRAAISVSNAASVSGNCRADGSSEGRVVSDDGAGCGSLASSGGFMFRFPAEDAGGLVSGFCGAWGVRVMRSLPQDDRSGSC